jgi:hypothetical protein
MEQPKPDSVPPEQLDQPDLGLVELPSGGQETAILVAVRIAEHHLLHTAPALDDAPVFRQREQALHHADAAAQILDRLEKGDQIDGAGAARGIEQAGLLEQDRQFQHVGRALALRDDAGADDPAPDRSLRIPCGAEDREFSGRQLRIAPER